MSWTIEIKPNAEKQYLKLDKKTRKRIKESLILLENSENPFGAKHVKPLTGELKGDFRLRVGKWRILFTPDEKTEKLYIYAILPRGDAY
jgi:mRNA interferase RelE/StbE